nr:MULTISPECIES: GNAT family N-acetyltransferase [unclassified Bradyrhizobium]
MVIDDYQGQGVGTLLMHHLLNLALGQRHQEYVRTVSCINVCI